MQDDANFSKAACWISKVLMRSAIFSSMLFSFNKYFVGAVLGDVIGVNNA